jgi:hypothetical protein
MNILNAIAAWAIAILGFATALGLLILLVFWAWEAALRKRKDWHVLCLMTAKAMRGARYNRNLVMPALEEWIGDSDTAAYSAIQFIRDLRPDAEKAWDCEESEADES